MCVLALGDSSTFVTEVKAVATYENTSGITSV